MSTIKRLDPADVLEIRTEDTAPAYGRTASGYGGKIPTRHLARVAGKAPARFRRVYAMCFGNSATPYVVIDGEDVVLPGEVFES